MFKFFAKEKKPLFIIILLVASISIFHSFYFRIDTSVDAKFYDESGLELSQGKGYSVGSINRPGPGYEFFLASIYYVFGHSHPAVWIIQAILLGLTALTAYFLAKLLFKESWHPAIGLLAAVFVGFSPDFIVLSSMLMTETLSVFLIAVFLLLFFQNYRNPRWYWVWLSVFFLAAATLTRGSALFLIFPAILFFIFEKRWREGFAFLLLFLVFMAPWTVRNYIVYGKFRPFNASPGLLWSGNYPGANGELNPKMPYPPGVDNETMSQDEFDDALFKAGLEQTKNHPLAFIKLTALRTSIYFSAARPSAFWPYQERSPYFRPFVALASSAHIFLLFALGLLGATVALKEALGVELKKRLYYFLAFFAMMPASVVWLVVETRYRFPAYIFFSVLAGYGIFWLVASQNHSKLKYLLISASPIFLNTLFDALRNWSRVIEKLS